MSEIKPVAWLMEDDRYAELGFHERTTCKKRTPLYTADALAAAYKRGYEEALNDALRNGLKWAANWFAKEVSDE